MIFIRISILFFILQSVSSTALACKDPIVWSEDFKLTWKHFQGNDPENQPGKSAILHVSIDFIGRRTALKPDYDVFAVFCQEKSWTRDTVSNILLMHEKLHFDITELFARKIRKSIIELRNDKVLDIEDYESMIQMKFTEFSNFQFLYDKETNHGRNILKQIEWNEKVNKELDLLSDYKLK